MGGDMVAAIRDTAGIRKSRERKRDRKAPGEEKGNTEMRLQS